MGKMLLTIVFSFFQNVFKSLPFLDRRNSGIFGTKTNTRGTDFLFSKKEQKKKLQPYYAGIDCMVIDLFSRELRGREKIMYCTQLNSEDGD